MSEQSKSHAYSSLNDRRAIAKLSTAALLNNLHVMQKKSPNAQTIAMVKANGYGHGIRSISQRLDGRVFALGVASIDEAIALRAHGIKSKIILMEGVICQQDFAIVDELALDLVIHDAEHLLWMAEYKPILNDVWIKVDIGMGRLGYFVDALPSVFERLKQMRASIRGTIRLMGHLSSADQPKKAENLQQVELFSDIVKHYRLPASLCNSAAVINMPEYHYDFVRPGFSLYGESPVKTVSAEELGLRPVMTVCSRIIAIKEYPAGHGIGYGHDYHCAKPMRIGVVSFGYGDGYPRSVRSGAPVLVDGVMCPLVGRISMDMMTVDLSGHDTVRVGSNVVLWGEGLPISILERHSGISRYELFTSVQNRVKFIWND